MVAKAGYHSLIVDVATGIGTLATILVCPAGTTDYAVIFSDSAGTAKANPFQTDSHGRFSFFADPGEYDIHISGDDIETYILSGVSILGPASQYIRSEPGAGEYHVKKIRLDGDKRVLITHAESPEE